MEVRGAIGVAGVADIADRLARLDLGAVLQAGPVRASRNALPAVVVPAGDVVVEVDVQVGGAAVAVEVEHAARPRRGGVELDLPTLRRHCDRLPGSENVVALVPPLGARIAEVVGVPVRADHGKDDRTRNPTGCRRRERRPCGEDGGEDHEGPEGCRRAMSHSRRASRPNAVTLPVLPTGTGEIQCGP